MCGPIKLCLRWTGKFCTMVLTYVAHEAPTWCCPSTSTTANKNETIVCDSSCWKYALEAIINGYYYISLFMIIVYCSCYNCVIRKS